MNQIDYWNERAKKYGNTIKAVNNDVIAEQLEYNEIFKEIKGTESILDLGCGNGLLIKAIEDKFPNCKVEGVELTKGLGDLANNSCKGEITICSSGDPFLPDVLNKYDIIITKRLLVNLSNKDLGETLCNIRAMLKPNGKYIMVECFKEPLERVNKIRETLNLPIIKVDAKHNTYLSESFVETLPFRKKFKNDFMSFYYLVSRTLNAKLSSADYNSEINNISKLININLEGYSPEVMWIFRGDEKW